MLVETGIKANVSIDYSEFFTFCHIRSHKTLLHNLQISWSEISLKERVKIHPKW